MQYANKASWVFIIKKRIQKTFAEPSYSDHATDTDTDVSNKQDIRIHIYPFFASVCKIQ